MKKQNEKEITLEKVALKSLSFQEEFEEMKKELAELDGREPDDNIAFRSFACHKLAAMELVLEQILYFIEDVEEIRGGE